MVAVGGGAAFEFVPLALDRGLKILFGDLERVDDVEVSDDDAAAGDGAHGEFFMSRDAELADHEDVEGCVECACDFVGDFDTAAREGEDEGVVARGEVGQSLRELRACVAAIEKVGVHGGCWF